MFFLVFSLVFLLLAGLAFLFGALKGRKYVWQFSVSRIVLNVISALVATALSGVVALVTSKSLLNLFKNLSFLDSVRELELGIAIENMIVVIIGAIAAAALFLPIFGIVRGLAKLALKALTRLLVKLTAKKEVKQEQTVSEEQTVVEEQAVTEEQVVAEEQAVTEEQVVAEESVATEEQTVVEERVEAPKKRKKYDDFRTPKSNLLGAMLGGVCGVITLIVLCIPTVGALDTVNDIAGHALSASDNAIVGTVGEIVDASATNVGSTVVKYTGGEALFRAMTYCEAEQTSSVTVKEDFVTVGEIVAVAEEHDLLSTLTSSPQKALTNEECTSEILLLILQNPRLSPVIDTVSDFAISTMLKAVHVPEEIEPLYDEFLDDMEDVVISEVQLASESSSTDENVKKYAEVFDKYGIRVDEETKLSAVHAKLTGADMRAWTQENVAADKQEFALKTELVTTHDVTDGRAEVLDAKHEAQTLAHAFAVLCTLADDMDSSDMDMQAVLNKLGPALDAFSHSETLGAKKTEYLLVGLLQSDMVHGKIGLSVLDATDTAVSICENSLDTGFEPTLRSLAKAVDVISAASDPDKDTTEAVKVMLDDLTPSSSKVLQTMATPSVVQSYNVPQQSAAPVSSMLSDTFGNLANAKEEGMSDEEYEKESAAVANMMDVLMSSGKTGSTLFGDNSVTGVSADEYVNNIMDSKVMSQTVMDNVYTDGETATNDPLKSERALNEEEKTEFLGALSNRWESSDKSEETQKKLISVAAVLNFQIEITDSGVAEVAPQDVAPQQ